jgi:hypothetical protein
LARNGQIRPAQLPPTAFSDIIHSDREKIKTKRKRMMGWIKNGPKKIELIFLGETVNPRKRGASESSEGKKWQEEKNLSGN